MQAKVIPHPATQVPKLRVVLPNEFEITGSLQRPLGASLHTSPFRPFIQVKQATLYHRGKRIRQEANLHICTHAILYIVEE
ncbi:MAG: hypothetical protein HC924_01350 [Synechococcaceae cyanobacterium SM2_3_2]|nr:hypothetical protein [Synechococcaceae cyanobacterium SM2_3_2]